MPPAAPSAAPHACRSKDDEDEDDEDLSGNKIVQFCKSLTSFTDSYDGDKFFTMQASSRAGGWAQPESIETTFWDWLCAVGGASVSGSSSAGIDAVCSRCVGHQQPAASDWHNTPSLHPTLHCRTACA